MFRKLFGRKPNLASLEGAELVQAHRAAVAAEVAAIKAAHKAAWEAELASLKANKN